MPIPPPPDNLKLTLRPDQRNDTQHDAAPSRSAAPRGDSGISALYGRVGDNVTSHGRGIWNPTIRGEFSNAYREAFRAVRNMVRLMFGFFR